VCATNKNDQLLEQSWISYKVKRIFSHFNFGEANDSMEYWLYLVIGQDELDEFTAVDSMVELTQ